MRAVGSAALPLPIGVLCADLRYEHGLGPGRVESVSAAALSSSRHRYSDQSGDRGNREQVPHELAVNLVESGN
jgi:hypothetical protein